LGTGFSASRGFDGEKSNEEKKVSNKHGSGMGRHAGAADKQVVDLRADQFCD